MAPLIIIGRLAFPSDQALTEWKAQRLDTGSFEWSEEFPLFRGESLREFGTVGAVLSALADLQAPSFFELERGESRSFLMPDVVDRLHQDLATAFRQAERVGAKGSVQFFVMGAGVALNVPVGEEPHHHHHHHDGDNHDHDHELHVHGPEWGPANALFHEDAIAKRFLLVMEYVQALDENPALSRKEYLKKEATLGLLPLSEQAHHGEILELLGKQSEDDLGRAVQGVTTREDRQLASIYATPKALREALRAGDPPVRAAAIEIFAALDPAAALSRVTTFLSDASQHVQRHAVRALGRVGNAEAFRRLLALDHHALAKKSQFAAIAILDAVKDSTLGEANALLRAELDAPAFRADAWKGLGRLSHSDERQALAERANHVLSLIGARNMLDAEKQLLALFDQHPAEEVRQSAARTLGQLNGPLAQKRAEEISYALMGMGKALNQDDKRRAELLGVDTTDESLGIKRYDDLDGERLGKLIEEHFADPGTNQNESPSIGQFFELCAAHPELRMGGYSVPISRYDYRISVDSIYVDIERVPADRRDEVEQIFEQLAETATNTDPGGGTHGCWWT